MCSSFNLAVLGPPLCGKSKHTNFIARKFDLSVIATGQIFWDTIRRNSKLNKEIRDYVYSGKLVPDHIVFRAINPSGFFAS
jgi:adenylate kinase family enzyme